MSVEDLHRIKAGLNGESSYSPDFDPIPGESPDSVAHRAGRSWQPVDLSVVLADDYTPQRPVVGQRSDSIGLFYLSKVHTVASESEAGKTWLLLAVAFDEIKAGHHCLYVDFEDTAEGITGRLRTLGLTPAEILEYFHYLRPTQSVNTDVNMADLFGIVATHEPRLAVIDGITEAMTTHGFDPLSNKDIALFSEMLPRKLSGAGCATVCLDHVVKDVNGRGRYALGGVHKLNGLDGAQYILESADRFTVGGTGRSRILIAKDRPGQLRKHAIRRKSDGLYHFADLIVESHTEIDAEFEIRPASNFRPTFYMEKISKVYEESDKPMAQRKALEAVGGKAAAARMAFRLLADEGYLSVSTPHKLVKPYRAAEDKHEYDDESDDEN
jgi:hypothetical protein